jgi:Tfp pilus assembly protein PilF
MKRLVPLAALFILVASINRAQKVPDTTGDAASATSHQTQRQVMEMRAEILMARKDFAQAVLAYQDLLRLDPKNASLLNKEGIAYQAQGEVRLAERYYKKALKEDGKYTSAVNNLGTLEYGKHHYGRAIKYYKTAITEGSDSAAVYSNLGYAYYGNKEYPQATQAFGNALAIDPDVFSRKGGSGSIIEQRSTTEPGMLNFLLAKSFAKAGDAERAARYLKIARDEGYKDYVSAKKDADFARVINDPRVQDVLQARSPYQIEPSKPAPN